MIFFHLNSFKKTSQQKFKSDKYLQTQKTLHLAQKSKSFSFIFTIYTDHNGCDEKCLM